MIVQIVQIQENHMIVWLDEVGEGPDEAMLGKLSGIQDDSDCRCNSGEGLSILTPFAKRLTSLGLKYQALPIISTRIQESLVFTAVDKIYADLLIIGSQGESVSGSVELHELLESSQVLGSVAQFCVKHCACPLLMFKPNAADMIDLILRPFVMARWVKAGRAA
ncbi:hypothetical protein HDU98_010911 [Podochytrium sp. JEL0797]|nr:hypothetical protein HDU98_010911 [Podochytrium sp. JEL0797]